jgi:hypothetical protein
MSTKRLRGVYGAAAARPVRRLWSAPRRNAERVLFGPVPGDRRYTHEERRALRIAECSLWLIGPGRVAADEVSARIG